MTFVLLALALAATQPAQPVARRPKPAATAPASPAVSAPAVASPHLVGEWPKAPSGKVVTLTDDATLDEALQKIAEAAGWSLVIRTGRASDADVVVRLRSAPVEEALDAVLDGTPLVATRRGSTVTVAPGPLATRAAPVLSGFDPPGGKRFTGDFSDAPVEVALRKVTEAAGMSLVLPPGVRGAVSGHFRDAPLEDVLAALLTQAGLTAARQGQVVNVSRAGGPSVVVEGGKRALTFEAGDEGVKVHVDDVPTPPKPPRPPRTGHHGDEKVTFRGDHTVGPGETAGQVTVIAGNARLAAGAHTDQVTAVGGSVEVGPGAEVSGEAVAVGGDVIVRAGGHVAGQAVSVGGRVIIDQGGLVDGEEVSLRIPGVPSLVGLFGGHPLETPSALWRVGVALAQFAVFFVLALLVQAVAPRRLEAVSAALAHGPVRSALVGILGLLAVPVLCLLLVVTVVGIPFVAVVGLALLAATILGFSALAVRVGRALPVRLARGAAEVQLALGVAALVLVAHLPVLGVLATMAAWLVLFGVILRTRFGQPPAAAPPYATVPPAMAPPQPPVEPPAAG